MSRIVAIGLTAFMLAACQPPADQTPAAEADQTPAAESEAVAAAPESAPAPSAPMTWAAMRDRYQQMEGAPSDPLEALEHRAVLCAHYSGEFGGDNSERDQWLNAQMDQYRCLDLVADARAMRDARSGEPAVVDRLDTVLAQFE